MNRNMSLPLLVVELAADDAVLSGVRQVIPICRLRSRSGFVSVGGHLSAQKRRDAI